MVPLPGGHFRMGGRPDDKFASAVEFPLHQVSISAAVALAETPVTQKQWQLYRPDWPDLKNPSAPVVNVSYADIQDYLDWLRQETARPYRLPSEAEWEYACRAGTDFIFTRGNNLDPAEAFYGYDESGLSLERKGPPEVAQLPPNDWGIFDCIGTVNEWTEDLWHSSYQGAPVDGTAWCTGGVEGRRVIRGGGWDTLPRGLRCSWRDWAPDTARWDNLGFRLALNLTEKPHEA